MVDFNRDVFVTRLQETLRGYRCPCCQNDEFGIGPLVAPPRAVETPDDLNPDLQLWQVPVTCSRCYHIDYFGVPEDVLILDP